MHHPIVRLLVGLVLMMATWSGARAAPSGQAAMTWQVKVGAQSSDKGLQANAFGPSTLTVNVGDTVNWTLTAFVHTVSFLSGGSRPPDAVQDESGRPLFNPAIAFPSGGPTYAGTGFVNSGMLAEPGAKFALTFTQAGTFEYVCLLHPGMAANVVVQQAGAPYPMTQAQVDARANEELNNKLAQAQQLQQSVQPSSQAGPAGTSNHAITAGIGGNQSTVLRFLPTTSRIMAGDSITWTAKDPHEIHTVTFYDQAGKVPEFIVPDPQPNGPPKLIMNNVAPEGGTRVESQGMYNSGILGPEQSYTFTFPKPGTYSYVCVVHAAEGMFGSVRVEAASALPPLPQTGGAPLPAALPDTGDDGMLPVMLVVSAFGLLLAGAALRRRST